MLHLGFVAVQDISGMDNMKQLMLRTEWLFLFLCEVDKRGLTIFRIHVPSTGDDTSLLEF